MRHSGRARMASPAIAAMAPQKKSATLEGCAKVPPKEEDLEECAYTLGEHRHEFIMPNAPASGNRFLLLCSKYFLARSNKKTNARRARRAASMTYRTTSTGT